MDGLVQFAFAHFEGSLGEVLEWIHDLPGQYETHHKHEDYSGPDEREDGAHGAVLLVTDGFFGLDDRPEHFL